jgi:hypothetical protein
LPPIAASAQYRYAAIDRLCDLNDGYACASHKAQRQPVERVGRSQSRPACDVPTSKRSAILAEIGNLVAESSLGG